MIVVNLGAGVALLIFMALCVVGGYFLFYNYYGGSTVGFVQEKLEQCPICTHVFYTFDQDPILMCPHCKSLIHHEA
jgi:hypothetical protein